MPPGSGWCQSRSRRGSHDPRPAPIDFGEPPAFVLVITDAPAPAAVATSDVAVEIAGATVRVLSADGPGDRLLGGIAVAAMRIDVLNKLRIRYPDQPRTGGRHGTHRYRRHHLAGGSRVAGLGLAAETGHCGERAAVSAYADKQGKDILSRQAASASYEAARADAAAARQDIQRARSEVAAIAKTASIADLEALAAFQRELIAKESKERGGCGPNCRKAEESLKLVFARCRRHGPKKRLSPASRRRSAVWRAR